MKTSGEFEKEFIQNIIKITGRDLKYWLKELKSTGLIKRNDLINWLKTENNFGHVNASWLAGIFLNNGKLVYQNEDELFENQFKNRDHLKPLFEEISNAILESYPDTKMIPKKTYISFTATREFVAVNIKSKEIRLGLDLTEDYPYNGEVQKSKLTGPMPRLSHMVVITSPDQINEYLHTLINKSYLRVN